MYGQFYSPSTNDQSAIGSIALAARARAGLKIMKGEVLLTLHFYGLPRNADLSNAAKLVEDAMNKVIYDDDKQICELLVYRHAAAPGEERTEVFVNALT